MMRRSLIVAGLLWGLSAFAPVAAIESRFNVLLDTDNDPATGCTVMTPAGAMDGVEAMLTTVVETGGADDGTVENVFRRECVDPATDTFGAEIAVGGGWPVGAGVGTAGFNVIETWMPPPSDTTPEDDIRLGLTAENELGDEFALLTTTPGDSQPIVLQGSAPPPPPPAATPIPTAGAAGLALLALVLLIAGLIALRRRAALFAVMLLAGAGYSGAGAYVFMFDWQGHSPLAASGATDPAAGVDVRAFFGQWDGSQLAFRLDAALVSGNAPAITSADAHDCEVGAACSFTFTADGLPEPDITLDGALPAGLDFDAENSTLSGTPEPGSGAAWTLTVTAANGIDPDAVQDFTLTVNEAPTITSADAAGCEVGQPCAFTFTADGFPAPAFDLPGLPAGLSLDANTGELSGTPDAGTGGTHDLTLSADNGIDPAATQAFTLTIGEAPEITSPDSFTCQVGDPCDFTFTADGDPAPTIDVTDPLPDGVTFDAGSASLQGTPAAGSGAEYALTVTAANGIDPDAVQNFTLTVNEAPAISSADNVSCEVGQPCGFTFTADGFPAPTFDLPGLPAGLNLDPSSGELSGTPDPGTGGVHNLTLSADNGIAPADTQAFTLTIGEAPEITSPDSFTCQVGDPCEFTFTADGDPAPAVDAAGALPDGVTFNAGTDSLEGTPAAGSGAEYALTVTAANGINPDAVQNFTLTVNEPPAITSADNLTCQVGQSCDFTFTADGFPAPEFDLPGLPAGLSLDQVTGVLSGTPDAGTGSVHNLTLTAANGIAPDDTQAFTLTIGEAPQITSADNFTCQAGDPCDFTFTATGFPAPEFDLPGLPAGLSLDPVTGVLSGTPDAGTGALYELTLTAANGITPDAVQTFTLTVNEAPSITSADNLACQVGQPCDFTFTAGGHPASGFDLPGLPAGLSLDQVTGVLSGTPDAGTGSVHNLTLTAANGIAPDDTQAFILTIGEAPQITSADNFTCQAGDPCDFTFTATGFPAPEFDLPGLPAGLSLDPVTGVLSGMPGAGTGALYELTLTAANGITPDAVQTFTLTVNEAPAITSADNLSCQVGESCDFTFTAEGHPAPGFDLPGLPAGLMLDPVGGVLSGTPDAGTGGVYNLTLTAANGIAPDDTQAFTLTIGEAPTITSPDNFTCQAGDPCDFTFTATGEPAPAINVAGALPDGMTFNAGTASLEGTPDAGSGGEYALTVSAANGFPPDAEQTFTLTVGEAPIARDDPDGGIPGNSSPGSVPYHGFFDDTLIVGDATGVLANDDPGFPAADIDDLNPPTGAGGAVALTAGGGFMYDPPAGFTGIDSFEYCLNNGVDPLACAIVEVAVGVRPAAGDDTFADTLIGNTHIDTAVSSGYSLFDLAQGDNISVAITGTIGGDAVLDAGDGTFIFDPDPGFNGAATIDFEAINGFGAAAGTVTLNVDGVIWYFDDSAPPGGNGRLSAPFDALSGAAASGPGHVLFLHEGSYTGGIALQNDQILAGHPAADDLETLVGVTAPADTLLPLTGPHPVLSGSGIVLAANNELHGIEVGNTGGFGIDGAGFGTLHVDNVSITGTGPGLRLNNGTVTGPGFAEISATSGSHGVHLVDLAGTVNLGTGNIAGSFTTAALEIDGGPANVGYAGTLQGNASARPVLVRNKTGGTVELTGAVSNTGAGVRLLDNTGAAVRFAGGISISSGNDHAFEASGGGTVEVCDDNPCNPNAAGPLVNTLAASDAHALRVVNTGIGSNRLEFRSISSSTGSATGIILQNTGSSGGLTVTGAGTPGSGGTIANKTGGDGLTASGIGIYLDQTASVRLSRMQLNDFSNFAIRGTGVNGFELTNSVINGNNGDNAGLDEGSVRFNDLIGEALVANSNISGGFEDNFFLRNDSGTLDRIVFDTVNFGANSAADGNDSLFIGAYGTSVVNATIQNSTFTSARGDLFQMSVPGNGAADLVFTGNTLSNNHPGIATGGGGVTISSENDSAFTLDVGGNSFRDSVGGAVVIVKSIGNGSMDGSFTDNVIGVPATANSGSLEGSGLRVQHAGGGSVSMLVADNQIHQYNNYGISIQAGAGLVQNGNFNIVLEGNTVSDPGNNPNIGNVFQGVHLNNGVTPGDSFQTCIDIGANTITNSGRNGGTDFRLRQRQSTTVRLPGYAGGAFDTGAVVGFVQGNLGAPATGSAAAGPDGGGFIGGGSCL